MDSRVSVLEEVVETLVFGWTPCPWNPNSRMRTPSISCTVGGKVGYFYTQLFRMFPVAQFSCHCHRRTNYSKSCYQQLDVCYNNSQLESSTVKPYNKKLSHSCQTLADFLMGKGALRKFSGGETLRAHF